jgi:hypothetical protein
MAAWHSSNVSLFVKSQEVDSWVVHTDSEVEPRLEVASRLSV